jgi:hypothetical protein
MLPADHPHPGTVPDPVRPIYCRVVPVVHRRCGTAVVLMRRDDKEMRRLDGLAAATWLALEQPASLEDLVDVARAATGGEVDDDQMRTGLRAALDALERVGLVEAADGAARARPGQV